MSTACSRAPGWPGLFGGPVLCAARRGEDRRLARVTMAPHGEEVGSPPFEQIVFHHRDRVFRVVLSVLGPGSEADAEDLAQEVFLRAHRALADFRGEAAVGTWLYRMAFNLAVDHLRNRRRRPAETAAARDEALASLPGPGIDPYRSARGGERARLVAQLLRTLPDSQRAALRLHYWMGHTVTEIAELLGVAPGTVKSWLHRGRERLRVELGAREEMP